jgi:hypothetical protein
MILSAVFLPARPRLLQPRPRPLPLLLLLAAESLLASPNARQMMTALVTFSFIQAIYPLIIIMPIAKSHSIQALLAATSAPTSASTTLTIPSAAFLLQRQPLPRPRPPLLPLVLESLLPSLSARQMTIALVIFYFINACALLELHLITHPHCTSGVTCCNLSTNQCVNDPNDTICGIPPSKTTTSGTGKPTSTPQCKTNDDCPGIVSGVLFQVSGESAGIANTIEYDSLTFYFPYYPY